MFMAEVLYLPSLVSLGRQFTVKLAVGAYGRVRLGSISEVRATSAMLSLHHQRAWLMRAECCSAAGTETASEELNADSAAHKQRFLQPPSPQRVTHSLDRNIYTAFHGCFGLAKPWVMLFSTSNMCFQWHCVLSFSSRSGSFPLEYGYVSYSK